MARILIADDEPSLLKVLKLNLEMEGHETLLASDGETALKRIEIDQPDVVLLDVMMPIFDGWEVLRRLNMLELRKRPKIIVMTAKSGQHDRDKGKGLGADLYITKPFEMEDLIASVNELVGDV